MTMLVIGLMVVFSSCNTNKYLKDDQQYVSSSKYKIKSDQKIDGKGDLQYELSNLEQQKPNKKFLGIARARLWHYYRLQTKQDTTKFNKWIAKVVAEYPSVIASMRPVSSAENMTIYLKRRGYFDATVGHDITRKRKTAYSTYNLDLKSLYTIDTVLLLSKDREVLSLLNRNREDTYLTKGAAVSYENYEKERSRIRTLLRNNGYAKFQSNFITRFRGDTTSVSSPHSVKIEYDIITPTDSTIHQKYYIGNITVIPEYSPEESLALTKDTLINGYTFRTSGEAMKVKPSILLENIFLKSGSLYRQRDQDKTSLQIGNLGLYRFISVKPIFNPEKPGIIDFEIYLTMNKKLALRQGLELNNTNRTATATSLVGTALSFNWRNRNLFGGAELFLLNLEGGFEINPSINSSRTISNINISTGIDIQIPKFNDYFGFWKRFGGKIIDEDSDSFYKKLIDNANSKFSTRFNYVDLTDAYSFKSFEISYGVNINNLNGKTWDINHFGIDYLIPEIDPFFALNAPEILKRSLVRQFLTGGIIPKEVTKKSVWRIPQKDITKSFTWHVEHSGLEAFIIDETLRSNSRPMTVGGNILSKFLSGSIELSNTKKFTQSNSFAYRAFIGAVQSYGGVGVVPFVKQFNGGGANSSRAWRLYELGPGSYYDPQLSGNLDSLNIIQTANLKLEFNAEYRFDISGRFKSAFFVDAGNIWTFDKEDPAEDGRLGAEFKGFESLKKEIAISVGTGLRMDFTYFIFRLDLGFKFRTPYAQPENNGKHLTPFKDYLKRRNRYLSIALGYPF